ncbi:Veg family protein [Olsenella massiliensis]|uniref:Veg family protein n=1 Tax=Olsenella massiliensis TaxID=1622075 RepID=UPI00071CF069|nr:Veg family protein [Olsenella massiliensis]
MDSEASPANRVDRIRDELTELRGNALRVRANLGRSRIVERTGTLIGTYDALFIIEVEERRGRTSRQSYQYVDVLTSTVELYDPDTGERLLDFTGLE